MKVVLTLTNRLAHELAEPATAIDSSGHEYNQALAELDAGVHTQLDVLEKRERRTAEQKQFLRKAVAMEPVAIKTRETLGGLLDQIELVASLSRSLRAPLEEMRSGLLGVLDGNAVIGEWAQRASGLLDEEAE